MCKNNSSDTACDHWRLLYRHLPPRYCEISIKATAKVSKNPLAVWLSVTVQVLCWAVWGQLQERISEKSEDEWGGSNSSPEVRFRIPGAHTTACLHTDIPAECLSTSKGPGMCVHVYLCMCVSVRTCDSFFRTCVELDILHSNKHHPTWTQKVIKTHSHFILSRIFHTG